jgi:hypothetical protein
MEYTTQIIQHGKFSVHILRPILTPQERAKRERAVVDVLTNIYKSGKSFIREEKDETVKEN